MKYFEELNFTAFEAVRQYFDERFSHQNEDYVFRGQARKEWDLVSTLNRLIRNARRTGAKHSAIEPFVEKHLDRFKTEIKGRRGENPPKMSEDEYWALGQHYGLATPLLDWTNSPYIALFFAFASLEEEPESYRCVWALNKRGIKEINSRINNEENKLKFVIPETENNKRIISQSGLFTKVPVMSSVNGWVEDYASSQYNDYESALSKIVIEGNRGLRKEVLKHLELMNIKFSTIFPDLQGASMYCNIKAENYEI